MHLGFFTGLETIGQQLRADHAADNGTCRRRCTASCRALSAARHDGQNTQPDGKHTQRGLPGRLFVRRTAGFDLKQALFLPHQIAVLHIGTE